MLDTSDIIVRTAPDRVIWRGWQARCALGRGGVGRKAREGDGVTPTGRFALRRVLYRADRIAKPTAPFPCRPIEPGDGWCDDPGSPDYNRLVALPHPAGHERLWRDDALYDLIVAVGFNDGPVVRGAGSAIFMHVARPDFGPTEGCVALALADLQSVLARCDIATHLCIEGCDP